MHRNSSAPEGKGATIHPCETAVPAIRSIKFWPVKSQRKFCVDNGNDDLLRIYSYRGIKQPEFAIT